MKNSDAVARRTADSPAHRDVTNYPFFGVHAMIFPTNGTSFAANAPAWAKRLWHHVSLLPRLLAVPVLLIYFPVLIGAGLLVCLTSDGPIVVKKAYKRGNGSADVVYLYELRTECWRTWSQTPVGTFLCAADLHRLPRLFNILQGDINVGERVARL